MTKYEFQRIENHATLFIYFGVALVHDKAEDGVDGVVNRLGDAGWVLASNDPLHDGLGKPQSHALDLVRAGVLVDAADGAAISRFGGGARLPADRSFGRLWSRGTQGT